MQKHLKNTIFLFTALSVMTFWACKTQQKEAAVSNTFIGYYLRYTEDNQTLRADATFKRGDSLNNSKAVAMPGNVSLNGQPLTKLTTEKGDFYTIEGLKEHPDSNFTFTYNDPYLAKLASHKVFFPKATHFRFENNVLSMKTGGVLQWEGSPLRNREEVMVQLLDSKGTNREIRIVGPTTAANFVIPASQLDNLAAGDVSVNLMRMAIIPLLETPHTKGSVTTEYYAKELKIKLSL